MKKEKKKGVIYQVPFPTAGELWCMGLSPPPPDVGLKIFVVFRS